MKKFGITILLVALIIQSFSQEAVSREKQEEKQAIQEPEKVESTRVIIGDNIIAIEDNQDALRFRIGNRGLEILESLEDGRKIRFERYPDPDEDLPEYQDERSSRSGRRFKGHWSGFEFGFNNYVTSEWDQGLPEDIYYMSLHTSKSMNWNFNFAQQSFGITRRVGFVTGLGIHCSNYRFDGNNNIVKGVNGVIEEYIPVEGDLRKSKFKTAYLTVPFMLEIQVPGNRSQLNIAGGAVGAIKLWSSSKMIFENGDKVKSNDDFSLNLLRYGPTARIGIDNFHIYATYYITPLFKSGKGPGGHDLYPYEIGFSFTFND